MTDRLHIAALAALGWIDKWWETGSLNGVSDLRDQLRAALAEPAPEPVAWRWLFEGQPEMNDWKGSTCWPMPGPDDDIIERAESAEIPRTVQYLWDGPPRREW